MNILNNLITTAKRIKKRYYFKKENNRTKKLKLAVTYYDETQLVISNPSRVKNIILKTRYLNFNLFYTDLDKSIKRIKINSVPSTLIITNDLNYLNINDWLYAIPAVKIYSLYDAYIAITKLMVEFLDILLKTPVNEMFYHRKMFPLVETYFNIVEILIQLEGKNNG